MSSLAQNESAEDFPLVPSPHTAYNLYWDTDGFPHVKFHFAQYVLTLLPAQSSAA